MPSLTRAVQSDGLAQVTLATTRAFCGGVVSDHVAPASLVVTTIPLPGSDAPLEPTAMQSAAVGQETALSCGVLPPATCCALHDTPPLVVAAMTVAALAGAGLGPATPTAQQRRAVAHDTAPSSSLLGGAGWPTASVVPVGSPRTRAALGEPGCPDSPQPDAVTATAARTRDRPPLRRRTRQCRDTERGSTARRE